jgi:chromate reductase, NAD(P)H dehydrogenase (quinone)
LYEIDFARDMRILAISGSLRAVSSNTAVLQAAAILAPRGVEVVHYDGLGLLPHFNPDLDGDWPPAAVQNLGRDVELCDGLLICSPEYAHGVAGSLKNALDWLVGSIAFPGKPVALINASSRASQAMSGNCRAARRVERPSPVTSWPASTSARAIAEPIRP